MQEKIEKLRELKLLFVEDEEDLINIIEDTLKKLNANFVTARNGKEALEILDNDKEIDAVITDINMPIMNGLEMIDTINKKNIDLPIIVMSAHTETEFIKKAEDLGVKNYLLKPFDFIKFIDLIVGMGIK